MFFLIYTKDKSVVKSTLAYAACLFMIKIMQLTFTCGFSESLAGIR